MGQGTSKYRKIMRTPQTGENAGKKLWYATAVSDREMSFEDFVTHISEHNSPYSRGTIHGVLMDTLDCLKHLILDGKSVRFSDLGLFSIGMTSRGEVSKEKVTAASVLGVHLIVRNTKTWSNAELKKLTKIVAYDDYTSELMTAVVRRILRAEVILARVLAGIPTRITAEHRRAAVPVRALAAELTAELTAAATT